MSQSGELAIGAERRSRVCDLGELRALERLAREGSSEKRRELMCRLSDLVADGCSTDETAILLGEILVSLVDELDEPDRARLSHHVAPRESTPHELARTLAHDESARVAEPVLAHSPVLTDADLVEVAERHSDDHLLAIARREHLSGCVTDAMIGRGTTRVLQSVAENAGAEITETGFRRLFDRAPAAVGLMETLSRRADIPRSVAMSAIEMMPPSHRERLQHLWQSDAAGGEGLVDEASRKLAETRLSQKRGLLEAKVAARDVERGARTLSDVILQFAGADRPLEVAHVLAVRARLPEKFVNGALLRVSGTAIALICRSVELGDDAFEEVARMRCSRLRLPAEQGHRLLQAYRGLDSASARRTVRFSMARTAAHNPDPS